MENNKTLEYLKPDTRMTLGEGIRELRAAEGAENDATQNMDPELLADLDMHDAIHVLFACSTDLAGEIRAHIWTALGTTVKMKDMHRVTKHQDHRQVLADIGHATLIGTWLKNSPRLLATMFRSLRMSRRWPAADYASYLGVPLVELRQAFGIILPPPAAQHGSSSRGGAGLRHVGSGRVERAGAA